jgi:hypothetical protein
METSWLCTATSIDSDYRGIPVIAGFLFDVYGL